MNRIRNNATRLPEPSLDPPEDHDDGDEDPRRPWPPCGRDTFWRPEVDLDQGDRLPSPAESDREADRWEEAADVRLGLKYGEDRLWWRAP